MLGMGLSSPAAVAVASKDIRVYFGNPMAYIVAMTFMSTTGVAFLWDLGSPFPEASLANFFVGSVHAGNVFGAALVLIPLGPILTMRLLAEERKMGTLAPIHRKYECGGALKG